MHTNDSRLKTRLAAMVIGLLAVLAMPLGARAQIGGLTESMKPEFFTRDLILFIEGLELDETQQMIAEALFEDYEIAFEVGLESMNSEIEAIQGDLEALRGDPEQILTLVLAPIQRWIGERELLGDQLIENVRVILIPEQESRWMSFNRKLYIEQTFYQGLLSGENLNLNHILRDMSLDPTTVTMIQPAVDTWSIEAMKAMKDRAVLLRGPHATIMEMINASDTQEDLQRKQEIIDARITVRETNDRGIQGIASALPQEHASKFIEDALMRAYPTAYRRTPAQRVLEAAAANTNYPVEIQEAVRQLVDEYLAKVQDANARILQSIQRNEPEREREKIRNQMRKLNGEAPIKYISPTKDLVAARKEMGREYIERLRELLSPDQFNELEGARRFAPPTGNELVPGTQHLSNPSHSNTVERGMTPNGKRPGKDPKGARGNNKQPEGKRKGPKRD